MKIPLTNGGFTQIDKADAAIIAGRKWYQKAGYAISTCGKRYRLHRVLMDAKTGQIIDHRNGDKLDNRRCNLRFATAIENRRNRKGVSAKTKYKGIFEVRPGIWRATLTIASKPIYLGEYDSEENAARAYDHEALIRHGEFARLNFPKSSAPQSNPPPVFLRVELRKCAFCNATLPAYWKKQIFCNRLCNDRFNRSKK